MAWIPGRAVTLAQTNVKQRLSDGTEAGGTTALAKAVRIYQDPSNTHVIYAGDSTLDPTTTPKTGVGGWTPPPAATGGPSYIDIYETNSDNGIVLSSIYVAGTANEVVLWSWIVQ